MKEHDCFILIKDLNPVITKGMLGVILMIYNDNDIEVEFVREDGSNYEYNELFTFTITKDIIELVSF